MMLNQKHMNRIILFSILLVAVYQFDDLVKMLHYLARKIMRQGYKQLYLDSDQYVGMALAIIGMPLALNYFLISEQSLQVKLLIMALMYLVFTILASGLHVFNKRLKHIETYGQFVGMAYAVAGLFHPVMRTVPWHGARAAKELVQFAFLLSIPPLVGWFFKFYYDNNLYQTEFVKYMDVAIIVMVGGLLINITIKALDKYLSRARLNFLGYFRIVLGAVITLLLFF
jgi:undecaprenyl pyrophosphate phosphatase UppP